MVAGRRSQLVDQGDAIVEVGYTRGQTVNLIRLSSDFVDWNP